MQRLSSFDSRAWLSSPRGNAIWLGIIGAVAVVLSLGYSYSLTKDLSPLILIAAPIGLIVAWFGYTSPEMFGVALLVLRWGFITDAIERTYRIDSPVPLLTAFLFFVILIRRFTGERRQMVSDATYWWIAIYYLVVAVGLWYAPYQDRVQTRLFDIFKDLLICVVVINLISSTALLKRSLWLLLIVGSLLATLTVFQEITQTYDNDYFGLARVKIAQITEDLEDRPRAGGPTQEPNAYGQQLLIMIPLGIWAFNHHRRWSIRLYGLFTAAMAVLGISLSFSRGSYLALLVVFVLYLIHIRMNIRYLIMLPILIAALQFAPSEVTARFDTLTALLPSGDNTEGIYTDNSFRGRFSYLVAGWEMFLDYPWFGIGADHFVPYYPIYIRTIGIAIVDQERNAHNSYLEVLAEHGIIGIALFVGMMLSALDRFYWARQRFKQAGNGEMAELAAMLYIAFIGYMVSAFFLHGDYPRFLWLQITLAIIMTTLGQRALAKATTATHTPLPIEQPPSTR